MRHATLALFITLGPVQSASAIVITDRSFFDAIPHTFLDFETTGDGTPLSLPAGVTSGMSFKEYETFGFRWNGLGAAFWGNDSDPDADAAISVIGSLEHVVGWSSGIPGLIFTEPTRSVGFGMYFNTRFVSSPIEIVASQGGVVIESVFFDGAMIDGQFGDIAYGFVGFSTDVPITSVTIFQDNFFAIDNLHFSSIPTPGASLLSLASVAMLRRRR